jgi:hypothetical protein
MRAKSWFPASSLGRQDGFVLPTVIFALVIIGVLWVGGILTSNDEARSERSFRETSLALYAAEAGLRAIMAVWPTASVEALNPGDSVVTSGGWVTLPDRSTYRVVIYRVDNGGLQQYQIVAQGRRPSQIGGQTTVTESVSGLPLFQWGIFSRGSITMSGSSATDAYSSAAGAYGGSNIDNTAGSIATNGSVTMSGSSTIHGDATIAGTRSGGTITGTVTTGASLFPVPPNLACPSGGYTPASSVPSGSGISYNAATGVLNLSGSASLTLPYPPTSYYFHQLVLSGSSTISFNTGGAHMDIYVDDLVNFSGSATLNNAGAPPTLGFWACGNPSIPSGWTLSGSSGAAYTVYAPNHDITLSGSSAISGSIMAKSITTSGSVKLHYDKTLLNTRSTKLAPVVGSWSQVSAF